MCRIASDLALDVADQRAEPRAHETQMRLGLPVATAMHQAGRLLAGPACHPNVGLAQPHAIGPCRPVQPFDRPQHQMAVGGMGYCLGLDGCVDGDAFKLTLADGAACHGNRDRLGQQCLELVGIHALAPVGHRGAVGRQPVLEMGLAAKCLEIRILHPGRADGLIRRPLMCFSKCSPTISRVGRPGRPTCSTKVAP